MKREKLTAYSPDNPLGWSEAEFRDIICQMVNIKILSGEPLTPLLNVYYLSESEQWKNDRLGLTQKELNNLHIKNIEEKINLLEKEKEKLIKNNEVLNEQ